VYDWVLNYFLTEMHCQLYKRPRSLYEACDWLLFHSSNIRYVRLACQPTSQHYCSLILNEHQPPATSQSAVLLFHNKSTPATSHSQANTVCGPDMRTCPSPCIPFHGFIFTVSVWSGLGPQKKGEVCGQALESM